MTHLMVPQIAVMVGQNNSVSDIQESLVVGNNNTLTGNLSNNIVVGLETMSLQQVII